MPLNLNFDRLTAILPPPDEPRFAGGDWKKIEKDLGVALPLDHKQFIHCRRPTSASANLRSNAVSAKTVSAIAKKVCSQTLGRVIQNLSGNLDLRPIIPD